MPDRRRIYCSATCRDRTKYVRRNVISIFVDLGFPPDLMSRIFAVSRPFPGSRPR
jgi:hypothetical protein